MFLHQNVKLWNLFQMFLWPWNYVSVYIECLWVHLTPVYWFNYTGKYICGLRATKPSNWVNIFIFEIYFVADAPMCALCKLTYVPRSRSTLEPKHRWTLDPMCRLTLEPRRISILEPSLGSTLEPRRRLTLEPRWWWFMSPYADWRLNPVILWSILNASALAKDGVYFW